jgi:type I restriction enzyme M protein
MVTVTRSARGLERAMTGKKYADQYEHTHPLMAGRGLEQQVQERPSGLPGGGIQGSYLSLNRCKELVHDEVEHRPPLVILAEMRAIEQENLQGFEELEGMLR